MVSKLEEHLKTNGKADVNCLDEFGQHPLYVAASTDDPEIIKLLIDAGADASKAIGFSGRTALHVVCYRSAFKNVPVNYYTRSVELLIKAGNNPLSKSLSGRIPLDELFDMGSVKPHPDFVKFMQRITQFAKQVEQGDTKSIMINE